ncbi:uncharacterized protein LOC110704620 [Chenopodium quinoa]|uniref:uncharacterized protein LOC110704620 n=1 Tax=Chenopodium quinoa TaxID=63459 RepID=UPI000B77F213|nr:uncharacterized protein LOC110704620 [Chenopodium quinoa]
MLDQGVLDLYSVHNSRDSLKETLKQTMLDQEFAFRRQVTELHELYRVQIARMEELKQKGVYNYSMHKGGFNNNLSCSMAEYMQFSNFNMYYELQQKPPVTKQKHLDLQLSADEFIGQCVDDSSGIGVVTKNSSWDKVDFDPGHLNLSLSIGPNASKKSGELRSWKGKKRCSSLIDIIDLEDENLSLSNSEACIRLTSGSAAPKFLSRDYQNSDSFLNSSKLKPESLSQSVIKNGSYRTTLHRSSVDAGLSCQTQSLCDSGTNGHHQKSLLANLLNENKRAPTCKINNSLDLNTVQLEDQSYFSNNPSVVVNSSITNSSSVLDKVYPMSNVASFGSPNFWKEANVNSFVELHGNHQPIDVNNKGSDGERCSKDGKCREGNEPNISVVYLDSESSEELCSNRSDPKISSVGSSSKILNALSCEMDMVDAVGAETNLEKGAESLEKLNCCKLSNSSDSEGMIDHHSSSIKTMQSGIRCDDVNFATSDGEKLNIGLLVTQSGEQDLRSSGSSESNVQCIIRNEPEVDGTIQAAAELLLQLSLKTGTLCEGESLKMPLKKTQNEENEQPQCSSESYEAMVLKAEEISTADYCVTSTAFLVDESENKDVRCKLKRGTRMKDFQKDILPGLSTLSRQEIREDINLLEGVIRSREYKKMRAKMGDDGGSDWCRTTRSKRSRVRRRYYA